jgi:hypothetical protein
LPHRRRPLGITRREFCQTSPQPCGIKLIDREHADTTRRTSLPADQPALASARRIRQRGIDDLKQFLVPGGWKSKRHTDEDTSFRNARRNRYAAD